ncbi:MAG: hypothetical protein ABI416_05245 [Ginsengibacter sp.]
MAFINSSTFIILCGKTGSGKSLLLQQIELSGYPTINLEKIASHRGSVFGGLLLPPQPSQQDFENELKRSISRNTHSKYIFIESKTPSLGKRKIPTWLYSKMDDGILIELEVEKKTRIDNLFKEYTTAGKKKLLECLQKLKERLPAAKFEQSQMYLNTENYEEFIDNMLDYYDQSSRYHLPKKATITLPVGSTSQYHIMQQLIQLLQQAGINISVGIPLSS